MPAVNYPIRNELLLAYPCYKNTGLEVCLNCSCTDNVTHQWVCCDSEWLAGVVNKTNGVDEPGPVNDLNSEAEADCLQNMLALLSFIGIFVALLLITACRNPNPSEDDRENGKTLDSDPSVHLGVTETKQWDGPLSDEHLENGGADVSEVQVSPTRSPQVAPPKTVGSPTSDFRVGTPVEVV